MSWSVQPMQKMALLSWLRAMNAPNSGAKWMRAIALGLACSATVDVVRATERIHFEVAAGPARETVRDLAQQAHYQVLVDPELVAGITTPAVIGDLEVATALGQLLAGTNIEYDTDARTNWIELRRKRSNHRVYFGPTPLDGSARTDG